MRDISVLPITGRICALVLLCLVHLTASEGRPMEVSREFSSKDRKDPDALQAIASRDRVPWNRRTALAWYLVAEPATEAKRILKTIIACWKQDGGETDVALVLAVSTQAGEILQLLMAAPPTQRIAAEVVATRAVMSFLARRRNADASTVRIRPAEGLPAPRLTAVQALSGGDDRALIKALLTSPDKRTAERALIAAAYTGATELIPEADAAAADGETADACRLMLRARHGQPLPGELVAKVVAARIRPHITVPLPTLTVGSLDVPAQCILLDAIASASDRSQVATVDTLLRHADLRVRQDACRAARMLGSATSVEPLIAALDDAPWPVLVEAAYALGELASAEAVEPLIAALGRQKGRFRQDLVHALSSIAGGQESRTSAADWSAWWEQRKSGFAPQRDATIAFRRSTRVQDVQIPGFAVFYDLSIRSDSFAFILDASGSMQADGKIDDLRSNASAAVRMLPAQIRFNVMDFGGHISRLSAYEDLGIGRTAALKRIADFTLSMGGTRSIDALAAGLGLRDADSLYFLSDGDPNGSQCDDWARSRCMLAMLTRHCPVAIHAICFHAGAGNAQGMWRMAVENAGGFQAF